MKKVITIAALAAAFVAGAAETTPLWMRDVRISPDGKLIAFTYKGDIYSVAAGGGHATRLTSLPGIESDPVWSPDGKSIAFASDRNGGSDIYIMDADGGSARRLTSNSATEIPEAFTPDGKNVVFSAAIQDAPSSVMFPSGRLTELYSVPVDGKGHVVQLLSTPAQMLSYIPGGKGDFLYQDQKGMENEWRKHHTSSVTRDVWRYDAASGRHVNLTAHAGEDRNPVVDPQGKTVYFLSERDGGSMNVYSFALDNPAAVTRVTAFDTHPVRFLSMAADGTLAMGYNGEIYTKAPGKKPAKVKVSLTVDEDDPLLTLTTSRGITDAAVSPDGKQIAVVKRGEIFVGSVEHRSVKRITDTPQAEGQVAWAPDNRTLYYMSERDGHRNIYKATIAREEDPNFSNATIVKEEPVFPAGDKVERAYPQVSPDGKELAFIEDRNKLMVMNLKTKRVRRLTDGSTYRRRNGGFTYSWSPDGNWIAAELVGNNRDPYTDILLINAKDGTTTNLTNSGYFDENPTWVLDGNAILFRSERYGMRNHASWGSMSDAMLVFLNREAYDRYRLSEEDFALLKEVEKARKKKGDKPAKDKKDKKGKAAADSAATDDKAIKVELDGIDSRIVRLTPNSSDLGDAIVTADGESLYYLSAVESGYDLWKINLRKGSAKIVSKLDAGYLAMMPDKDGKIYLLGANTMKKLDPKSDRLTAITVSTSFRIDPAREREAMFENMVVQEREMFYTKGMHGVDWNKMAANYRRFLPHINNNADYAEMLSELLGELNVSHTGARYYGGGADVATGSLGLLYDMTYDGDGLKVAEVVTGGPFDHASLSLKAGDVITAVNGTKIDAAADHTAIFNDIVGKKTLVTYRDAAGKSHDEVVIPITAGRMNRLLYDRWVRGREADVERLSGGRLGYVHLQSMDDESFREVYSKILGKYNNREGIVIDTRWNGGGRLHEDIEILFSGNHYFTQEIRGYDVCDMPSRRWNKPSIMIQCEANYSNAHGTPWVYKHRGLGKLVGAPVPGTMTSVNWMTMQDPSLVYGIPVIGYRLDDGTYLENQQLEPDIMVLNDPAEVVKGVDEQLKVAVETLLRDIDAGKKAKK